MNLTRQKLRGFTVTYQYSDIDQHEALYNLARRFPGGIDALAFAMGRRQGKVVSPNVLRNKLRPGIASHALSYEEASLVVELCEEAGVASAKVPVQAFCWRHGLIAVEPPFGEASTKDVFGTLGVLSREFAELVAAVTERAADGEISVRDRERIHKEALDVMRAVMQVTMTADAAVETTGRGAQ